MTRIISGSERIKKFQSELDRLEDIEDRLEEGISEHQHELRRVNDGLEREGGQSLELQNKAKMLRQNIELSLKELKQIRQQQEKLTKQLDSN